MPLDEGCVVVFDSFAKGEGCHAGMFPFCVKRVEGDVLFFASVLKGEVDGGQAFDADFRVREVGGGVGVGKAEAAQQDITEAAEVARAHDRDVECFFLPLVFDDGGQLEEDWAFATDVFSVPFQQGIMLYAPVVSPIYCVLCVVQHEFVWVVFIAVQGKEVIHTPEIEAFRQESLGKHGFDEREHVSAHWGRFLSFACGHGAILAGFALFDNEKGR